MIRGENTLLYRLGDMVRYSHTPGWKRKANVLPEECIGHQYVRDNNTSVSTIDWDLLRKLTICTEPQLDLVYHLRLGDRLNMITPEQYVQVLLNNNLPNVYNTCNLMYGVHQKPLLRHSSKVSKKIENLHTDSDNYVEKIMELIPQKTGMDVNVLPLGTTDTDFKILCNAKCLIPGIGGYGYLAGCINKNKVLWDICRDMFNRLETPWSWVRGKEALNSIKESYKRK
jgi:hypothetical protein